ncbi:hypothetical protein HY483_00175 [Candidatus Woesearchaeota archaeon]|nr:hypothetical protein [Candidatus Woesearchaeota archaeon]
MKKSFTVGLIPKFFFLVVFSAFLIVTLVVASGSQDVLSFSNVFINGVEFSEDLNLAITRGSVLELSFLASSISGADSYELQASISGYSLNDVPGKRLFDSIILSNIKSEVSYPVKFSFLLPDSLDTGTYSITITVWDRSGLLKSESFSFFINAVDHGVNIQDVMISGSPVIAGDSIFASARLENNGWDSENVRLEFSLLGLDSSDVLFIDKLNSGSVVTTRESLVIVPDCASPGEYLLSVHASFRDGRQSVSKSVPVKVLSSSTNNCPNTNNPNNFNSDNSNPNNFNPNNYNSNSNNYNSRIDFGGGTSLDVPESVGVVSAGEKFSLSVKVSNTGDKDRAYRLSLEGSDSVGNVWLSPSVLVISSRSSDSVRLEGVVDDDAFGERIFFISVSPIDGSDIVKVPVSLSVDGSSLKSFRYFLEVLLIILVLLLLGALFYYGWRRNWIFSE